MENLLTLGQVIDRLKVGQYAMPMGVNTGWKPPLDNKQLVDSPIYIDPTTYMVMCVGNDDPVTIYLDPRYRESNPEVMYRIIDVLPDTERWARWTSI